MSHEVTFQYQVDWDDDDDWDLAYEDITLYVKSAEWELGLKPGNLVSDEATLTLTVNNEDRRFSPENAGGPYFGQLLPQRKVRVRTTYKGVTRTMCILWLQEPEPQGGDGRTAALPCVGPKQFLQDQKIRLPLLENVRSDEVIAAILEAMMLPPALGGDNWLLGVPGNSELGETTYLGDLSPAMALDSGLMTFPFVADTWDSNFYGNQYVGEDWSGGFSGWDAIEDVCRAERGRFFLDREGKAVFWARDRLQTDVVLDETFDNEHQTLDYSFGADVATVVRVKVYPRALGGTDEILWKLEETLDLNPQERRVISANYSDEASGADIAGQNAFVDTFTFTSAPTTGNGVMLASEFQARGARLELHNVAAVYNNQVTALVIKGKKLTTWNEALVEAIDGLSRAKYGPREYTIDSKLLGDMIFAQSLAEFELSRRKDARGALRSITIQAVDDFRTTQILSRTIGDRIRVIDDQLGHDAEYFIVGEAHSVGLRDAYSVTWYLESADMNQYWVLGVAGFSELGETTWLGL